MMRNYRSKKHNFHVALWKDRMDRFFWDFSFSPLCCVRSAGFGAIKREFQNICMLWEKRCTWIIEKTQCLLQYHQKKSVEDSCALLQFTFTVFSFSSGSRSMLLFGYLLYFSLLCVCFRVFWMDIEANNSGEDKKVFHIHFFVIHSQANFCSDHQTKTSPQWLNFTCNLLASLN